jgi:hypothetical protein
MQSTIGRTGVNVLSPVRMADRRPTSPEAKHEQMGSYQVPTSDSSRFGREPNRCEGKSITKDARLPFPVANAAATVGADISLSTISDEKEAPLAMVHSRSQGIHDTMATGISYICALIRRPAD